MIKLIGAAVLAIAFASSAHAATAFDCQKGAAKPATKIGAYTFKQVCKSSGKGDKQHSAGYPQIAATDAASAKWNALASKTATMAFADNSPNDFDTSDISYSIGTASAKLISVHFDFYANSDGTAHPTIAQANLNVTMPAATSLKASDVFKVTPQWKTFMAKQLAAGWAKVADGVSLKDAGITNDKLTDQATNPQYWLIDTNGLTIETGDLVDAPNSDVVITVPWAALKPYLAANAPVP